MIGGIVVGLFGVGTAITIVLINPRITRYVEGPAFRAELEKQTAKGLHFPDSSFAPVKRTGFLTAQSDTFRAKNGRKAMTEIDASGISARFNPFGIFLRRWQLDELHIERGVVGIQVYEPKPEPSPTKPWYHVFLPDRVYLKEVISNPADITWRLRGRKGGIFGTSLRITPHGRDFEYDGTGGTMKNAFSPDLPLLRTHLLITRTIMELYYLDLSAGKGRIHGEGHAQTRGDRNMDCKLEWNAVSIREWMPNDLAAKLSGEASGDLHWTGNDFKLEKSQIRGALRIREANINNVEFLDQLAVITNRKDLAQLHLNECATEIIWDRGKAELKNVAIEENGKFRIEGNVTFSDRSLGGAIRLGLAREYLDWLPNPEEVFTESKGEYLWTTVHLSGTLNNPQQDLSPRLIAALKESPGRLLMVTLRALGAWLHAK